MSILPSDGWKLVCLICSDNRTSTFYFLFSEDIDGFKCWPYFNDRFHLGDKTGFLCFQGFKLF